MTEMTNQAVAAEDDVRVSDSMRVYLREIGSIPMLTPEEERILSERAAAGDDQAKARLVNANLRLVVSIARRYSGHGISMLDLVQDGNIGLIKAANKFDPEKDCRFSTYATFWIRQTIGRGLADKGRAIRVPVHVHEIMSRVYRTAGELEEQLGRVPDSGEIAEALGFTKEKVEMALMLRKDVVSLDSPINDDADAALGDIVADERTMQPDSRIYNEALSSELARVMQTVLTEKERDIIILRFGLAGSAPLTLEEIGQAFGVTRERIRQIEAKALRKLREAGRRYRLNEFL